MKFKIETDPVFSETEIILRAPRLSPEVLSIQSKLDALLSGTSEISVRKEDREVFVPTADFLFFETYDGRVRAHTAKECYDTSLTLSELLLILPRTFARASKCCIVNTEKIRSISRFPTGLSLAAFSVSEKTVTLSRQYYKSIREIIEETRLKRL